MDISALTYQQYILASDKNYIDTLATYVKPAQKLLIDKKNVSPKYSPLSTLTFNEYIFLTAPISDKRFINAETEGSPNISIPFIALPVLYRKVTKYDVLRANYLNVIAVMKWVANEFLKMSKARQNVFSQAGKDIEWNKAGGNEMERFGDYGLLNFVSGGDITKESTIKNLPYSSILIFADITLSKQRIEKRMMDNVRRKNK